MDMDKMRVVLIGAGMIANSAHLPSLELYRKEGKVDVVGIADVRTEAAAETAKRWGIPHFYEDPQKMLDELHPDLAVVCTPNMFHKQWTLASLRAGAHVACEKPMGLSVSDVREMWQTAKDCGKNLFPCQCMRWRNCMQMSKQVIDSGELGNIYFSDVSFIRRIGIPTWGFFHMKKYNFGGPFCDLGVHLLDSLFWLCGDRKVVSVSGSTYTKIAGQEEDVHLSLAESGAYNGTFTPRKYDRREFDVEDLAVGFMRLSGGMSVNFKFSWALHMPTTNLRMSLCGDRAGLSVDGETLYKNVGGFQTDCGMKWFDNGKYKGIPFEQHRYMYENIMDTLSGRGEYLIKEEQNIEVTKAIEAFYCSAAKNREVMAEEIGR